MKILFFFERVNINLLRGDSVQLKRLSEGLAGKGHEVHAVCHGFSEKIKIHSIMPFWFYTKAFTFPLTSFFSFSKFLSLIKKNDFDVVAIRMPVCFGSGFWFNLKPFLESSYYSRIVFELKKRRIPFFVFVEGITEKESFISSFMGCSRESQMNLMKESNGIICLSKLQNGILYSFGLRNPMAFFPSPIDTKKYLPEKQDVNLNLSRKINLLYLSASCDLNDFMLFFGFLQANNCVLYVISPFALTSKKLINQIKKLNLSKKIVFLGCFSDKKLLEAISSFDAGVYLKKFGFPFADSSYMMKISEYLSCGLPVLVPEMKGPLHQAGSAGINFEKTKKVSRQELKKLSVNARKIAVEKLDLEKNIQEIERFFNENK